MCESNELNKENEKINMDYIKIVETPSKYSRNIIASSIESQSKTDSMQSFIGLNEYKKANISLLKSCLKSSLGSTSARRRNYIVNMY